MTRRRRDQAGLPAAGPRAAPRRQPRRPEAEARFKEVALAYEVLSTPSGASATTGSGPTASRGVGDPFAGFGGLGDIFDAFFGGSAFGRRPRPAGPPRGADLEVVIDLDFEEAVFGVQAPVTVRTAVVCETARHGRRRNAARHVRRVRRHRPGPPGAPVDPRPDGHGRPVPALRRRRARSSRSRARTAAARAAQRRGADLHGRHPRRRRHRLDAAAHRRGAVGPRGGGHGDLYVHVRVASARPVRARRATTSSTSCPSPFTQAALGAHLAFDTLDGDEDLVVPAGTQTGRVFRLRGRGVPHVRAAPRRPARAGRGRHADRSRRGRGGAAAPARRAAGRGRRARRRRLLLEDPLRVQVTPDRRGTGRTSSSPTSTPSSSPRTTATTWQRAPHCVPATRSRCATAPAGGARRRLRRRRSSRPARSIDGGASGPAAHGRVRAR